MCARADDELFDAEIARLTRVQVLEMTKFRNGIHMAQNQMRKKSPTRANVIALKSQFIKSVNGWQRKFVETRKSSKNTPPRLVVNSLLGFPSFSSFISALDIFFLLSAFRRGDGTSCGDLLVRTLGDVCVVGENERKKKNVSRCSKEAKKSESTN